MKKLYLKSALLLVLTVLVGLTSCKKDEFEKLSLSFSSSSVDIDENGFISLKKYLVIQPSNLDTITVAWSSSDESVATVSKNGSVEGVSIGNAVITASAHGKSATIKVNVTPLPIEDVTVPEKVDDIWVNVPYKLDGVGLTPSGASLKRINWSDESGKLTFEYNEEENAWYVTATEAGTYNVKATADEHEAESIFTVKIKTIDSITLSETSLSLLSTGTESRTATLTYTIKPEDASYQEMEWSVTPSGIINFDNGKITTIDGKEGTVTVTLKHKAAAKGDKDIEATCKVTVTETVAVESFELSTNSTSVKIGSSVTIDVKDIKPASGDVSKIKWTADNTSAVKLSATQGTTCTITGIGSESKTVKVTVTAPNGFAQNVTVSVQKVAANLKWDITPEYVILFGGTSYTMPLATVNSDATVKDITYSVLSGTTGQTVATDITLKETVFSLDVTTPNIGTSEIKRYRLVAKCDGHTITKPVVLFASNFIQSNIDRSTSNTEKCGTYNNSFTINAKTYIKAYNNIPSTVRDSIFFSPDKSEYHTIEPRSGSYNANNNYQSLAYKMIALALGKDIKERAEIRVKLYDYKRNLQSNIVTISIRNSFLGYKYAKYDSSFATKPSKEGDISNGSPISFDYIYDKNLGQYWRPKVSIFIAYHPYFTSDEVELKELADTGGQYYKEREQETEVVNTGRGSDKLYVRYK